MRGCVLDQSLESQIAQINQRLTKIEKSIETLMSQTKSSQRVSDIVYVKGATTISSYAPSVSKIVQS